MTENLMNVMESSKGNEEQLTVLPCPNITEQTMHSESKDEAVSELTSNLSRALNQHVATEVGEVMMLSPTSSKLSNQENEKFDGISSVEELEVKSNVNIDQAHNTISVLTSTENQNDFNTSNCSVNKPCTEHEENKVDNIKSCSNHNDYTQCINGNSAIHSFPHSPSCITTKTVLPSARPPSRLPHKTPMSSKSATPISTLTCSPSISTSVIVSPESIASIEQPSIITQSLSQMPSSSPPTSIQNMEIKTHITDTRISSTFITINEKGSNSNHFFVKELTNNAEIVQSKLCNGITNVLNGEDANNNNNTHEHLSEVNGKIKNTSAATNKEKSIVINTSINSRTEVSLQRKRLHEFNTNNNENSNNHDIKTKANVMQSSTSHLSKESSSSSSSSTTTTAVVNNTLSPVNSPSSLVHHEEQQNQRLNLIANRHQRKLQNWSDLLVKAMMQHECESHVNMDSVREICTRIAHAIPGDAQAAKDTLLMLLVHLRDPENGELRQRLITGTLPVEVLITMDEHDLVNPRRRRKLDEEFEERAKDRNLTEIKKAMQTTSRLFACPVCKERDCSWYQKQTRSADEPMTIFCTCNKCNTTWKRY